MPEDHHDLDADVLVVGTGPMGATTALALATYGVRVLVVSRGNWLADSPRAHVTNVRTMEVLRSLGLEDEAERRGTPWELMGDTAITTSLAGPEIARIPSFGLGDEHYGDYRRISPCRMLDLPQPLLEPMLVDAAAARGAQVRFNSLYRSHVETDRGVTVTVEDRTTGVARPWRVRYLVGADGARSRVMENAGLTLEGVQGRAGTVYAQFSGDLSAHMAHRKSILTWIANTDAAVGEIGLGLLRAVRPWDRWIAGWGFDIDAGDPDLSVETARERIRAYVGDPRFEPEVTAVGAWYVNEAWAERLSRGRVFCGGDAVHRHPPSNGLGSNTSIQDAFNLAWKLAYVVRGDAGPSLLDTYTDERAPVAKQIVHRANQSRREYAPLRALLAGGAGETSPAGATLTEASAAGAAARAELDRVLALKDNEYNALGVETNHRYRSGAVVPDDRPAESWARDPEVYAQPSTRAGAKLPHAWVVAADGRRVSTLDLVGDGTFTLLTGLTGGAWVDAVGGLALPFLRSVVIGGPEARDLYSAWRRISGIAEDGALLVRPDGYIAWRSEAAADGHEAARLGEALSTVLGRRLPA